MVQRARNLAIAGKNAEVEKYAVMIDPIKNTADLVKYDKASASESLELLTFTETSNLHLTEEKCTNLATITFQNGASEPALDCNLSTVNILKIQLKELDASDKNKVVREKTFSINHISGVPQL